MSTRIASPSAEAAQDSTSAIQYSFGVGATDINPEQRVAASFAAFSSAIHDRQGPAVPTVVQQGDETAMKRWKSSAAIPWISAPMGGDGKRRGRNALPWPIFIVDIDQVQGREGTSPIYALSEFIAGVRQIAPCFGYTTSSHTDERPRARLVLHLSRPVSTPESRVLGTVLSAELSKAINLQVGSSSSADILLDLSMQDSAHIAFGPIENAQIIKLHEGVLPLDVDAYLARERKNATPTERDSWAVGRPHTPEAELAVREALGRLDKRYPDAVDDRKEWLRVLAALKAHDWPDEAMAPIAEWWSAKSPKFDPERFSTDWDSLQPQGGISASTLYFLAGQARASAGEHEGHLSEIDLSGVMASELPEPGFLLAPLLPRGQVTLLGGHGGVGKSMLALEISAHVAAGRSFAGFPADVPAKVVFLSLEDDRSVVLPRLRHVIDQFHLPLQVIQNLKIFDYSGGYGALMTELPGAGLEATALMAEMEAAVTSADLIVIDNASEAFDGNENARRHVRQFIAALRAVGQAENAVILLLAHIDKAAAIRGARDNSYSGSTAWHNGARSRLALVVEDASIELRHEKSNYAPPAQPVRFLRGAFGILAPYRKADQAKDCQAEDLAVFRALVSAGEKNIRVSTATSGGKTSWRALIEAGLPEVPNGGKRRTEDSLRRLEDEGLIARQFTMNPYRRLSQVWEVAIA